MAEISGVSESAVTAGREVRTVFSRLRRRLRDTYDPTGLTTSQSSALSQLDREGETTLTGLAAAERVRHQSMASVVGVLEERGLVERRPDPADGRRQLISVSAAGRAFLADRRHASQEWLTRVLEEHFTEAERRTVVDAMALLDRLNRL
ncbi:MarR family winged helix-turn-helix transcriptional regulator [Actinacidiphila yeochonensis]|uniref:MarR family winged helix-turn-helix transcriptional regulator n=1 Tax=Actinacidiphila yeochonensis TaxID=89050 RepID=UPI0005663B99|nr:MarR family transcriptional regulator [Actinacidiphila yeochonensis]